MSDGIPSAVRKAGEDADTALAEFERKLGEVEPSLDAGAAPAAPEGDGEPAVVDEPVATPTDAPPVGEPAEPAPTPDFQQRYQTLQGKYNAEVPRLHREIADLRNQLAQVATRQEPIPAAAAPDLNFEDAIRTAIPKEQAEQMDPEALKLHTTMISAAASKVAQKNEAELKALRDQVAALKAQSFWARVEQEVSGAAEINNSDPLWRDFLDGKDAVSGLTFREIGERAFAQQDAARVVNLLKAYLYDDGKAAAAAVKPKPVVKPGQSPVGRPASSAAAQPAPASIKVSDITAFYSDVARGKYGGREADRVAREAEIDRAVAEGRVGPG